MERGWHGIQSMKPSSSHDRCIGGWHIYYYEFGFQTNWSSMNSQRNPAHWLSALSQESKQGGVVGLKIGLFETELSTLAEKSIFFIYFIFP